MHATAENSSAYFNYVKESTTHLATVTGELFLHLNSGCVLLSCAVIFGDVGHSACVNGQHMVNLYATTAGTERCMQLRADAVYDDIPDSDMCYNASVALDLHFVPSASKHYDQASLQHLNPGCVALTEDGTALFNTASDPSAAYKRGSPICYAPERAFGLFFMEWLDGPLTYGDLDVDSTRRLATRTPAAPKQHPPPPNTTPPPVAIPPTSSLVIGNTTLYGLSDELYGVRVVGPTITSDTGEGLQAIAGGVLSSVRTESASAIDLYGFYGVFTPKHVPSPALPPTQVDLATPSSQQSERTVRATPVESVLFYGFYGLSSQIEEQQSDPKTAVAQPIAPPRKDTSIAFDDRAGSEDTLYGFYEIRVDPPPPE
eukprot:gene6236-7471_t